MDSTPMTPAAATALGRDPPRATALTNTARVMFISTAPAR
jgi:hypothetical protein